MEQEILTFGDIVLGENKFYRHESPALLKDLDIGKVLASRFPLVKNTISALLVTCIIIIKLSLYTKYFPKQALM